jgi:hypothetical protein
MPSHCLYASTYVDLPTVNVREFEYRGAGGTARETADVRLVGLVANSGDCAGPDRRDSLAGERRGGVGRTTEKAVKAGVEAPGPAFLSTSIPKIKRLYKAR